LVILALGAAFVFILQNVTEQAISSEFDRRLEEMTLLIERRSRFEEKVLLDKYVKVTELQSKIERVTMGGPTEPLNEVMRDAVAYRYLIGDKFFKLFVDEKNLLFEIADEKDSARREELGNKYQNFRQSFSQLLNEHFGIDRITWETINR
jgi:hypothetical protein